MIWCRCWPASVGWTRPQEEELLHSKQGQSAQTPKPVQVRNRAPTRLRFSYLDVLLPLSKSCDLSLPDLILPEWYTPHWIWPVIWKWQRLRKFNLSIDLSWQDHHEHFLFVAAEHMLHKSPPRADQDYCEKEESTLWVCLRHIIHQRHGFDHLQKMSDIVQDCPRLLVYTIGSNLGVVDLNITN